MCMARDSEGQENPQIPLILTLKLLDCPSWEKHLYEWFRARILRKCHLAHLPSGFIDCIISVAASSQFHHQSSERDLPNDPTSSRSDAPAEIFPEFSLLDRVSTWWVFWVSTCECFATCDDRAWVSTVWCVHVGLSLFFCSWCLKQVKKAGALGDIVAVTREKIKINVTSDSQCLSPSYNHCYFW
jgi:hypothetical protein